MVLHGHGIAQVTPGDARRDGPLQQALAASYRDSFESEETPLDVVILPDVAAEGLLHAFMDVLYYSQQLLLRRLRLQVAADDPRLAEGLEVYRSRVGIDAADSPVWPRNPDGRALEEHWFAFGRAGIKPNASVQNAVERMKGLWGDRSWGPFAPFRIVEGDGVDIGWVARFPDASGCYAAIMRYVRLSLGDRCVAEMALATRDWPRHGTNEYWGLRRWPTQEREISAIHTLCVGGARPEWKLLAAAGEDLKRFGQDLAKQCRLERGDDDRMAADVQLVVGCVERIVRGCVVAEANCGRDVAAVRDWSRSASGVRPPSDYGAMLSLCSASAGLAERVGWRPMLDGERVSVEVAGKRRIGVSWIR
ncbi:MAG: hypothetical protein JNK15_16705 [Planctomycetes bacterium]|nr:hypothetical protein [Planctomycetota bacterium]